MNISTMKRSIKELQETIGVEPPAPEGFPYLPTYDKIRFWRSEAHYLESQRLGDLAFSMESFMTTDVEEHPQADRVSRWTEYLQENSRPNPSHPNHPGSIAQRDLADILEAQQEEQ